MLLQREAAHVADHHQDVFVHRVDVEQVELHAPRDTPEGRDVAALPGAVLVQEEVLLVPQAQQRAGVGDPGEAWSAGAATPGAGARARARR